VRGVNWLGDAVMTTPALQRLRERFPQTHIELLTHQKLADLWLHHPSIDGVITFAPRETVWSVASIIRCSQVQNQGASFDLALVLPNSPRSALEIWLAGIPQRIGYARPWRSWMLTQSIAARPGHVAMHKRSTSEISSLIRGVRTPHHAPAATGGQRGEARITHHAESHQIYDYLHLASALGTNPEPVPPQLFIRNEEVQAVEKRWLGDARKKASQLAGNKPLIFLGLNPAAAYGPAKRWPAENFAAAVREVSRSLGNCVWIALGGIDDVGLCEELGRAAGGQVLNLAGKTSLRELMALLKLCRVLLTNDSGPMHVAAALGTPVVVPFGSTAPELTGPGLPNDSRQYLLKSDAPCSPCFRRTCPIDLRCMTGIGIPSVVEAVLRAAAPTM
jgi:heptosyltransferase-2